MDTENRVISTVEGTGAAINLELGFVPSYIKCWNIDAKVPCSMEWVSGMGAAKGWKKRDGVDTIQVLSIDNGSVEIVPGDTILEGAASGGALTGASAKVVHVPAALSGAWATDDWLGFIIVKDVVGAWTNNEQVKVGSTQCALVAAGEMAPYNSLYTLAIDNGAEEIAPGDTVLEGAAAGGALTGASAVVVHVPAATSGAWATDDWLGSLIVKSVVGTWTENEQVIVGETQMALVAAAATAQYSGISGIFPNRSTDVLSSLGISEYAGSASSGKGVTIGADTNLNVDGETILYMAFR